MIPPRGKGTNMSKARIYLATAIDKEIGSVTYYVMDAESFSRILSEDVGVIGATLAAIEEQTPTQIFTEVRDLISFLEQNNLAIAEEAVGVFADAGPEMVAEVPGG
jgi:hypothetical protein